MRGLTLAGLGVMVSVVLGALACARASSAADRVPQTCVGPTVSQGDARPIAGASRRDVSEATRRLELLRQAHCALAKGRLDDVRKEQRILAEGNSSQTYRFPGLDEVRSRLFAPSLSMNRCVRLNDITVVASDLGEWGGGVEVVDRRQSRKVFDGNVQVLAKTSAGLIAVGGLSHMAPGWGFLAEIRVDNGSPRVASLACLPSDPEAAAVDTDGTLIVVLTVLNGFQRRASTPREMTIAVDDDGVLYDSACDTGNPGQRLATSWDVAQDTHGCMELAWGMKIPRR